MPAEAGRRGTALEAAPPALRADVDFTLRPVRGGAPRFLVEDRFTGVVHELGEAEVFLCRHLDGRTPLGQLAERYEEEFGAAITDRELDDFVRQLGNLGLLVESAPRATTLPERLDPEEFLPAPRLRFGSGDRFFSWLDRRTRWIGGRTAWILTALLAGAGGLIALLDWTRVWDAVWAHWSGDFLLLVVLLSSALIHGPRALAHGLLCKRYGGHVGEVGLMFLYYLLPWTYCDWSDAVWMRERSRRLAVIASGLGYQLAVWGFAMIAFWLTETGPAHTFWLALAVGAGGGLILMSGNPLVKLDGYLLLVAWVEVPRLRERALAAFGARLFRRSAPEPLTRRERRWFLAYGLAVFVYASGHLLLFLVLAGRSLTEALGAGGAAATILLAAYLVHRPLARWAGGLRPIRWLLSTDGGMKRWAWRIGIALVVVLLLLIPYPYETGGAFTLLPGLRTEVHCEVDGGRVVKVFVREGDSVKAGQPLGAIDPREFENNVRVTQAQLEANDAQLRLLRKDLALLQNPPNIESIEALEAEGRRLRALLADYRRELELTRMDSPIDGRVTTPLVEQSVGKYLKRGDLFATVEQAQSVQVQISVPETDVAQVKVGAPVKVVAWAYPYETFHGTIKDIAPLALTSASGAPAPDRTVRVIAEIPNPDERLKTQLTGYAKIRTERIPVWLVLSRLVGRWFAVQVWYWLP